MNNYITPVNIAAAAMISQFSLIAIISIGSLIALIREPRFYKGFHYTSIFVLIIIFSGLTIGYLLFSNEISSIWKPLFGDITFGVATGTQALHFVLLMDIILISLLVNFTGGSKHSIYSPIYFIIPVLAIFLRDSQGWIIFMLITIIISFSYNLFYRDYFTGGSGAIIENNFAFWFISVACFVLATTIGFITRPIF